MDPLMERFLDIFEMCEGWGRSRGDARRAGLMIFLHPKKDQDWVTGVMWDPNLFIRQNEGFDGHCPMAWRRDFVEKVVALGYVPDLESYPQFSISKKSGLSGTHIERRAFT